MKQLNEYYFLTDPDHFIYEAYPSDSKWQLLTKPWTLEKFLDVPYCTQNYFKNDVNIVSRFSGRLLAQDGHCEVEMTVKDAKDFHMNYELYYNHKKSGKEISSTLQFNNYVFLNRSKTNWNFGIRFPESGVYKLKIVGGRNLYEDDLCFFRIVCDKPKEDCKPLPVNPGKIGYGPSLDTIEAGLEAVSHKDGFVHVTVNEEEKFSFNLLRTVRVRSELSHTTIAKEDLSHYVNQIQTKDKLNVLVTLPEKGEYALQLHAQQEGQSDFKNVCNYLLESQEMDSKDDAEYDRLHRGRYDHLLYNYKY